MLLFKAVNSIYQKLLQIYLIGGFEQGSQAEKQNWFYLEINLEYALNNTVTAVNLSQ